MSIKMNEAIGPEADELRAVADEALAPELSDEEILAELTAGPDQKTELAFFRSQSGSI